MRQYFADQYNKLKDLMTKGGVPGSNPAGMAQAVFENRADNIWNDALAPGLRVAGKVGLLGGALFGAAAIAGNQDTGKLGDAIGGAVIGGVAGASLLSLTAGKAISTMTAANQLDGPLGALKKAGLRFGAPAIAGVMGATMGAAIGGLGIGGSLAGAAVLAGGAALYSAGIDPTFGLRAVTRAVGGPGGIVSAAMVAGRSLLGAGATVGRGLEFGARVALTGGLHGVQGPLDAWFPFFRNTPTYNITQDIGPDPFQKAKLMSRGMSEADAIKQSSIKAGTRIIDPRKFAPNPRIIRRLTGIGALFAVGAAFREAASPQVAPPSLFFDGRNMRHVNDLGTGGGYGMGIMGRNSSLNMNYQDAARMVSQMF